MLLSAAAKITPGEALDTEIRFGEELVLGME